MRRSVLRKFCIAVAFFFVGARLCAQPAGSVSGRLIDEADNGRAVVGAVVECHPLGDPDNKKYATSAAEGKFALPGLGYGTYAMRVTFMGLEPYVDTLKVDRAAVRLGTILMKTQVQQLGETVVESMAMRTTQNGDTVVYNAGSFKVSGDASTDDLLGKMPGIKVEGGNVEAHGEQVKKVLVDGKEFFGDDVTAAIKNLPAEVIDKIEVFDKKSDEAEFSGVNDGNDYKAINIVTTRGVERARFGKFYAGYGISDLYNVGMSLNLFDNNRRFSVIGMANNVNQQNFAIDDLLDVMGTNGGRGGFGGGRGGNFMIGNQSGVSTVKSIGVNYSNEWKEKLKLSASYFFNTTKNETDALTQREYFSNQLYDEYSQSFSRNFNHRINARVEYKMNESNTFMFRPSIRFQSHDNHGADTSATLMRDDAASTLLNFLKSATSAPPEGYNSSGNLLYMHRFGGRAGRVLSVSLNGGLSKNDRDNDQYSLTRYFAPDSSRTLDQYIASRSSGHHMSGRLSYSEPVSEHAQVLMSYNLSYNFSDRDKRSYEMPEEVFLDSLSNTYNSGYLTHRVGPGFRYNGDKAMFVTNVNYQYATLTGDQLFPSVSRSHLSAGFNNVVYMAMLDFRFSKTNTLRAMLRSNTDTPSVTQLQNVLDVSNPLFISQGNPDLRPVYSHNLSLRYVNANVTKGRTFMAAVSGSTQSNHISNAVERADRPGYEVKDAAGNTVIVLDQGAQYSRPVNLNGYWNVNGVLSYGLPVRWLASNVNFNVRASYTAMPTVYNKVRSTTTNTSYAGGVVVGSNISDKIDFTVSYNASYNVAHSRSDNEYFSGVGTARVKWVTWGGITLQADGSYSKYRGITDSFSEEFLLVNAALGKKLFKQQRGEISLRVNDLLNRNKSFVRTVSQNYIQNVTTNVLGRYVSLSFVYNLRVFKGKGGKTYDMPSDYRPGGNGPRGGHGGDRGGRPAGPPMGPPPGGGMPHF